jgi:hypothetical protein
LAADRNTALAKKAARDRKSDGTGGASEEVSLYRSELIAIHFNSKNRPAPAGKRGTEACIPNNFGIDTSGRMNILGKPNTTPSAAAAQDATGGATEAKGAPMSVTRNHAMYNIVKPFDKIREAGAQNEMYSKSCFVVHERTSR